MSDMPLAVAIAAVVHDGKILLIRRRRGDYAGLWGLPGGKIEEGEHPSHAAPREIAEEAGIEAEFKGYLGLVSERLEEDGKGARHFLLHLCELKPLSTAISQRDEGELGWFPLDGIGAMGGLLVPSDLLIIQKMVHGREGAYYDCVLRKSSGGYALRKFSLQGRTAPQAADDGPAERL